MNIDIPTRAELEEIKERLLVLEQQSSTSLKPWIRVNEAAELLGTHTKFIYSLKNQGHVTWTKEGGVVWIHTASVMDRLEANKVSSITTT